MDIPTNNTINLYKKIEVDNGDGTWSSSQELALENVRCFIQIAKDSELKLIGLNGVKDHIYYKAYIGSRITEDLVDNLYELEKDGTKYRITNISKYEDYYTKIFFSKS